MSCKSAKYDEDDGYQCEVSGSSCMFMTPNSKACAEKFGEGPDADQQEDPTIKQVYCPNCNIKLGEINKEDKSVTFEKGVEVIFPNASVDMIIYPFKCPNCCKTNIEIITI